MIDATPHGFVRVFHVTPARNAKSILKRGILCSKSKGKLRRIWLCDAERLNWALVHVARHHKTTPDQMRVFTCEVNIFRLRVIRLGVFTLDFDMPSGCVNLTA